MDALEVYTPIRYRTACIPASLSEELCPKQPLFGNHFALFRHPVITIVFISLPACRELRQDGPFSSKGKP